MKGSLITLFALVAAPALALEEITAGRTVYAAPASGFEEIAVDKAAYTGSIAGRAAALADSKLAARAEFFCKLPTSAVSGAPRNAADIDGMPA